MNFLIRNGDLSLDNPIKKDFNNTKTAQVIRRIPFTFDLDGDGIDIDSIGNGAHFDLDKNGFA